MQVPASNGVWHSLAACYKFTVVILLCLSPSGAQGSAGAGSPLPSKRIWVTGASCEHFLSVRRRACPRGNIIVPFLQKTRPTLKEAKLLTLLIRGRANSDPGMEEPHQLRWE